MVSLGHKFTVGEIKGWLKKMEHSRGKEGQHKEAGREGKKIKVVVPIGKQWHIKSSWRQLPKRIIGSQYIQNSGNLDQLTGYEVMSKFLCSTDCSSRLHLFLSLKKGGLWRKEGEKGYFYGVWWKSSTQFLKWNGRGVMHNPMHSLLSFAQSKFHCVQRQLLTGKCE